MATTRPRRRTPSVADPPPASPPPASAPPASATRRPASETRRPRAASIPEAGAPDSAILRHALQETTRLLRSDGAIAYLLDESTGVLRFADDAGITDDDRRRWVRTLEVEIGVGMFGRAVAEGRVFVTDDYAGDTSFVHFPGADRLVRTLRISSFVVAPLISGERTFGAIGTYSSRAGAFGEPEIALVRALADHAAAAIANTELIERLARSQAELEVRADAERALREIGGRITGLRDVGEVLQVTVDEAARLLGADGARIDLLHDDGGLYWAYDATTGKRPGLGPIAGKGEARAGEGISGRAVRERRPVRTGDYLRDPSFEHAAAPDRHVRRHAIRSVVAVPLIGDRGPLGTLTVYAATVDAFTDDHARLIEALAGQAAIAMTNARLIEELDRSRAEFRESADAERSLREIAARLTAIRDPSDLLQDVVDEAARLLRSDRVRIDLLGPIGGRAGYTHLRGAGEHIGGAAVDETGVPYLYGASGRAIRETRTVVTGDYPGDTSFDHDPGLDRAVREDGIRSLVVTPMTADGELLGVLQVGRPERDAFGPRDVGLAEALAHQAAIAIQNARLIEELDRSSGELARRADAQQSLREIAARITAIREPGPLLQQVVDAARRLVGADGAILDLLDPSGEVLRWAYDSGVRASFTEEEVAQLMIPIGIGATGLAVAEDRVIVAGDDLAAHFPDSPVNDRFFAATGFRSMIIAPVTGESGPLGALEVYATAPNAFDDEAAAIIRSLAYQAAIAITNARLIEELDRSRGELARRADAERSLREIAKKLTAIREPRSLLGDVAMEAARLLRSRSAIIDVFDEASGEISWGFDAGVERAEREEWYARGLGDPASRLALQTRAPVISDDYAADGRFEATEHAGFIHAMGLRSIAVAPLVAEGEALGTLAVFTDRVGAYGPADAELLTALADQAALAIQNAHLIEQLDRSRNELARRADTERALRDIAARITSLRDPGEVLSRVVEESRRLLGSDGAHLTRMSDDRTYLVPVIVAGAMDDETEDWLKQMQFPLGGGINGLAAGEVRPIWTEDYLRDARIPHEPDDDAVAERLGLRAMAAAPLRASGGEVIGTLAISYARPRRIEDDELDLLQGLADQAAIALTNSTLYERLGESEARYRHLVQDSPDLIWSIDAEARFTFVSDTCERLTGWRPEELLGRHFGALVHESSADVATIDWTTGLTDAFEEVRGRVNLLHRDGHPIPAEFAAFGTLDETGRFAGANGSVRDMTERDRLERDLRESEERYRFLVENAPDIIFAVDVEGRISYISERVERSLGYRPEELVGRPMRDIVQYGEGEEPGRRWATTLADPATPRTYRVDLIHRDGRRIPFDVSTRGAVWDGTFGGIHGSARDVSERERLERDLRRQAAELASSQERAHLARELHDSVTQALFSMTLITRSTELLLDRDPDAAKEKLGSLRDLQREALAEMRALIFELRPANLETDGLLPALKTHSTALQGRIGLPIVVSSELPERLPLAIEEVLYRIAQEGLHNVVKHAAARQVRVSLDRRKDGGTALRIEDDGKGFEPGAVPDGHLGLAGMRARAEKIGASLAVTSRPGAGTTVEVVVPDASVERARAAAERREAGLPEDGSAVDAVGAVQAADVHVADAAAHRSGPAVSAE